MNIENIRQFIKEKAEQFGAKTDNEFNKPYVERNNTGQEALKDNGAYFGFIHPEEEASGPFHDFSLTIFPNDQDQPWLVCLGIGSSGFKNDYELATYPGLRRLFSKLINEKGFCKSDFSDIETSLPKSITGSLDLQHIKNTIKTYTKVLPACQIVDDPESEAGKKTIAAFVAGYAKLRDWPSNKDHRKAISEALEPFLKTETIDEAEEIKNRIEDINKRYAPIKLNFKMYPSHHPLDDDNLKNVNTYTVTKYYNPDNKIINPQYKKKSIIHQWKPFICNKECIYMVLHLLLLNNLL